MKKSSTQFNDEPIISVKDARRILGSTANTMSDIEVLELINEFDAIALLVIDNHSVLNTSKQGV